LLGKKRDSSVYFLQARVLPKTDLVVVFII
jgi:hypothetical protein